MKRHVLGIDGGGTKTQALIVDEEGHVRGWGMGGPSNYDEVGMEKAKASFEETVRVARQRAALPEAPFDLVFLGMAGVVSDKDRDVIRAMVQQLELVSDQKIDIDHDCRIALAGGLSGRPGIVLIVGTGLSCYGENASGEHWISGGGGHLISDEGSSYWLGIQAMRCAAASHDGRLRSVLKELVKDLMHRIYVMGSTRSEIASLAPFVIRAACQGDRIALDLRDQGADLLTQIVCAAADKIHFAGQSYELALVGTVFNASKVVFAPLTDPRRGLGEDSDPFSRLGNGAVIAFRCYVK